MKAPFCLLPLLLAAPAYCAEGSALLDLLPPNTQIVVGAHVRAVVDSSLARGVAEQMPANQAADLQRMIALIGFDPLHDVDEVLVATTVEGQKAPTLMVASGKFDAARLSVNSVETYNGVTLMSGKGKGDDGVYAFLDGTTALAGTLEEVKAAIDRRGSPAPLPPAMGDRIAQYREHYDIWGVVNRTAGLTAMLPPSARSGGVDSIDRLNFGVALKSGLDLTAEVHASTPKDAEQLAATLQFLESMTRTSQPAASNGTKFSVKNVGGTLKLSLSISEEDLKKAIETQRKAALLRATNLTPTPKPAAPPASATVAPVAPTRPVTPTSVPAANGTGAATLTTTDGGTAVFTLPSRQ